MISDRVVFGVSLHRLTQISILGNLLDFFTRDRMAPFANRRDRIELWVRRGLTDCPDYVSQDAK